MIQVLDHGYVKVIDVLGSDERIIESARMSTDKGFIGWGYFHYVCQTPYNRKDRQRCYSYSGPETVAPMCPNCGAQCVVKESYPGDEKLLKYLYTNKHATPFEFGELVIEVQAPIFVIREWQRHRTQGIRDLFDDDFLEMSFNEMSGRYVELPDLCYVPSLERMQAAKQSTTNKQSSDEAATFTQRQADAYQNLLRSSYTAARGQYQELLSLGVAREVARLCLPVAQYSRMRAKANLRNWLAFLTLRMAPNAQWEIRQYANVVGQIIAEQFPRTWQLFIEGMR